MHKTLAACVGGALVLVGGVVEAQTPPAVFTAVQPAGPIRSASMPADDERPRLVRVDQGVLAATHADAKRGTARLTLDIAQGVALQAIVEHTAPTSTGFSLSGRIASGGVITWVVNDERVTGTIWTPAAIYDIVPQRGGIHAIRKVDQSAALPLGEPLAAQVDWESSWGGKPLALPAGALPHGPQVAEVRGDDGSRVDVLVLWTPAVRSAAGGESGVRTAIDLYVATTNDALRNSGANLQIRLVGAEEVAYTESGSATDLRRLRGTTDGHMDAIHARRDALGADLVSLITTNIDAGGRAFQMNNLSVGFSSAAFSVVTYSTFSSLAAMAFAHELGHNMGLAHDRFVESQHSTYAFARGYVNAQAFVPGAAASDCWSTIMAYRTRCDLLSLAGTGVPYYSTPLRRYPAASGDALGVPKTSDVEGYDGPADAVQAIEHARLVVANFRSEHVDDGDTRASATTVTAASSTLFAELDEDDVDYFRIELAQASSLRTTTDSRIDTVGTLLSAEGTTLADDDDSGYRRNFLIERPLAAGVYFIRVAGDDPAIGSYALTVLRSPTSAADDHGDTAASSTVVAIPSTTAATLADARDVDALRFELSERRLVEATTSGTVDTVGMLRVDGDLVRGVVGDETFTDDDSGAAGNFKITGKLDPGVHSLAVRGWDGAHGTTTLKMSFPAGTDDHGDNPTGATTVSLPGRVSGELEVLLDRDIFRIDVAQKGLLRLHTQGETDTFGTLTAADGSTIASNDDDPNNWPNFRIGARVEPGTYFLRLRGWRFRTGPYVLMAELINQSPSIARELADLTLAPEATADVNVTGAFHDPEGAALAYAVRSSAEAVASATVSGATATITAGSEGEAAVTVTATDPGGLWAAQSFAVTVQTPNRPPSIARQLADLTLAPEATADVDLGGTFRDPEGADLVYSATSSVASIASVAMADAALLTIVAKSAGQATVRVTATDPGGLAAAQSFAVTVATRPTAKAIAPLRLAAIGESSSVNLAATFEASPGGAPLTFSATSPAPSLASVTVFDGLLTVTANDDDEAGTLAVRVTATDSRGLATTLAIHVQVWATQRLLRGWRIQLLKEQRGPPHARP